MLIFLTDTVECMVYSESKGGYLYQGDSLLAFLDYSEVGFSTSQSRSFTVSVIGGKAGNYRGTIQYEVKIEPNGNDRGRIMV